MRVRRLSRHRQGRFLVVPLDHSVSDGPVTGGRSLNSLVGQIAAGGADAVVLHRGTVRYIDPAWFDQMNLIIHLSASTSRAADPDDKFLVGSVEGAAQAGADAVSVHVNLGSITEAKQIADMADIARECETLNLPLLAMVYPRGQNARPDDPDAIAHAVALAADLGADIVKTCHPGTAAHMAKVTAASPIPVIVAGGRTKTDDELESFVLSALEGGAIGVAAGRAVFNAAVPRERVKALAQLIHHERVADHARLEIV